MYNRFFPVTNEGKFSSQAAVPPSPPCFTHTHTHTLSLSLSLSLSLFLSFFLFLSLLLALLHIDTALPPSPWRCSGFNNMIDGMTRRFYDAVRPLVLRRQVFSARGSGAHARVHARLNAISLSSGSTQRLGFLCHGHCRLVLKTQVSLDGLIQLCSVINMEVLEDEGSIAYCSLFSASSLCPFPSLRIP